MYRTPYLLLLLACSGTFFSSCRTVYAPNAVHVPLLQEKGELKASIATNNLQIATAFSEHMGVMVNGYLNRYTSDDKTFKNNGQGAEVGLGYFAHTKSRLTYEGYAGLGYYQVKMKEDTKSFETNAMKYFIQPSLGWVNPYFEVAITPRLSMVKYAQPDINGYSAQEQTDNYFNLVHQKMHVFLEPALTVRGGYRFVKIQAQVGHAFKLSKNNINYDDGIGSVGLIFNIADWYKK